MRMALDSEIRKMAKRMHILHDNNSDLDIGKFIIYLYRCTGMIEYLENEIYDLKRQINGDN